MRRRGAGLGAIKNKNLAQEKYKNKGVEIAENDFEQMSKQLDAFKTNLEEFARKHKDDIKKNPEFRSQFQEMCASIGVDPLASGQGFWSEMLGVGDFYYELGVQIIEVCMATNHRNGGLMTLDDLRENLIRSSGRSRQDVSADDLLRAIKKLKVLGNGFSVIPMGPGRYMVQSVPGELSMDHTTVIQQAEKTGYITMKMLKENLRWEDERCHRALDYLLKEGQAWVDNQDKSGLTLYWLPGLFTDTTTAT